jgi:methylated-DNA-[protein]-cysteine S-methyltransferase
MIVETDELASPIGTVVLAVHKGHLCALGFREHWGRLERILRRRFADVEFPRRGDHEGIIGPLRSYFRGDLAALDSIPLDLGGTAFQQAVWTRLRAIPAGQTISYRDLAVAIGVSAAVRAVGAANGSNPVSIVVPCHRVIGADGALTGYGGGIARKQWLLAHEGAWTGEVPRRQEGHRAGMVPRKVTRAGRETSR